MIRLVQCFAALGCVLALVLACVPGVSVTPADAYGLPVGETMRSLLHDGRARNYILYVPASIDWSRPVPLVFVFHGATSTASLAVRMSGFNAIADEDGFLVVYPNGTSASGNGTNQTWNAGTCCGYAKENHVDDVGFVRAIVADLQSSGNLDPQRIYAAGMSNGAMMSYRLACEAADLFAAVAPVAGKLALSPCTPAEPIPLIAFHGTEDGAIVYNAALVSVEAWASLNACNPEPIRSTFEDIYHDVWMECVDFTDLELYTIVGGDHSWPGDAREQPGTDTIAASPLIWEFFAAHPKPAANSPLSTRNYLPIVRNGVSTSP
ncbi:MAG: alpha/beta hydrolase family esterase [Chloroflexota bacterium]